MRPTGKLHLGHLVGALQNWVPLQEQHDCFYFVADWHALTTDYADTSEMIDYAYDNVVDWIAAGISPERSTLFVVARPGHAELCCCCRWSSVPWLERVPTTGTAGTSATGSVVGGFLGYPLLQTAVSHL